MDLLNDDFSHQETQSSNILFSFVWITLSRTMYIYNTNMAVTMAKKVWKKSHTITLFILAAAVKPKVGEWVWALANMRTQLDKVFWRGLRWAWIKSMPLQRQLGVLSRSGIFSHLSRFYYKLLKLPSLNDHSFVHMYNSLHYSSRI